MKQVNIIGFLSWPLHGTRSFSAIQPDGYQVLAVQKLAEVSNLPWQTEEQFNSREPVPLTITPVVNKVVSDASVDTAAMENALKARTGMPTKVNGAADNAPSAPIAVPENNTAMPVEQPMTPATPQGANVQDPNAAAPDTAPVDTAAPATNPATGEPAPAAPQDAQPVTPATPENNTFVVPKQPGPVYESAPVPAKATAPVTAPVAASTRS